MTDIQNPVPHLTTLHKGPLHYIEDIFLDNLARIESWFREQWRQSLPTITSSVDLRHSGLKLAPVDTNLFPAGYNNLNPEFMPLCVQAMQSVFFEEFEGCKRVLVIPESHTRNLFYMRSLAVLVDIINQAGFDARVGSMDPEIQQAVEIEFEDHPPLLVEPLQRQGDRVGLENFNPCVVLLNNDLSSGIPEILQGLNQRIHPQPGLGWSTRLKSDHFTFYQQVAEEFSNMLQIDPWLINPIFTSVSGIDFMAQEGMDRLAQHVSLMLENIKEKYKAYGINNDPFVVIKADSGTYGMSVMTVRHPEELMELNRKQRKKMAASKGSQKVDKVLIQEGVHSFEVMADGSVAEPVVYLLGQYVVGGFYRVHKDKGPDESLNAPGMHFEPLAFAGACNVPRTDLNPLESVNRFYSFGVVARLAALAAARERKALKEAL